MNRGNTVSPAVLVAAVAAALLLTALLGVVGTAQAHPSMAGASQVAVTPLSLPVRVETDQAVVRAEAGLESLAQTVAARVPDVLAQIRADLAELPAPMRLEIRLVKRAQDLPRVAPRGRGAPTWASGVAYPDLGIASVATRREHQPIDTLRVTDHELAHLALGAALGGRAPRWLDEGFAFVHASELSLARAQLLIGMAWTGDTAGLAELERGFYGDSVAVDRAYAQSYDFVSFLTRRGRYPDPNDDGNRWPFRRFLIEIGEGHHPDDAAKTAFGVGLRQLLEEWNQDLRSRYLLVPSSLFVLGVWVLAAILLVVGYIRRRLRNRRILALWAQQEAAMARRAQQAAAAAAASAAATEAARPEPDESAGRVIWVDWSRPDRDAGASNSLLDSDDVDDAFEEDDSDDLWLN